jgi:hypothetical protein
MSLPSGYGDTTFERFLQEQPEDFREMAIEFKAFSRSRKIKTPEQVLQVVLGLLWPRYNRSFPPE